MRHAIENHRGENRETYIGNVIDVIKRPDEIWSNKTAEGFIERYYLKYYKDYPIMMIVDIDKNVHPYSFFETTNLNKNGKKILNTTQLIEKRRNQLIYRK